MAVMASDRDRCSSWVERCVEKHLPAYTCCDMVRCKSTDGHGGDHEAVETTTAYQTGTASSVKLIYRWFEEDSAHAP
jgi:hypothetical protein